jgi:hypothetical protein
MTELLQSLRSDLLSRRMLPLVAVALLALVAALGYALAGGSGGAVAPHASSPSSAPSQPALAVAAASPNPNAGESETPGGIRYQSQGPTRNPFTPLPEPKSASSSAKTSSSSSSSSSKSSASGASPGGSGGSGSGGSSKSGGGGGSSPPPTPAKPAKPAKPKFPYDVSVLFGRLPATAGQPVTLPPYQNLRPQQPIPSAKDARIALERVSGNAKSAVFTLLVPAILRGAGVCLPSASECQQLALEVGHAEELEYIEASGQTLVYELKTVSIAKSSSLAVG